MTRFCHIRIALLMAVLVAAAAPAGVTASAQDASPAATPASGCSVSAGSGTPVASPAATSPVEPALLTSPERLVWAGGPHAVVLLHQNNLGMRSWIPQAETLVAAGYTVVAIENAGPKSLQIALADLRARCQIRTITIVGASIGGQIAQNALRDDPAAFDQIILLSSDVDVPLLGDMPKLFVASEGEGMSFDPVAAAAESAGDDNTAVAYPGTAHAQDIFPTEHGPALLELILAWLAAHP